VEKNKEIEKENDERKEEIKKKE